MSKITVTLGADEWYPVIQITKSGTVTTEISQELFERHNRIMQEFDDLQDELYKLYKGKRL